MTQTDFIPKAGLTAYWPLFATVMLWGSAFPAIGYAVQFADPLPVAALRFSVAALLLTLWLSRHGGLGFLLTDLPRFLICGALGIAVYNAFLNAGMRDVSPGAACILIAIQPVIAAGLSVLFLKERFGAAAWGGAAIALVGAVCVGLGQPGDLRFGSGSSLVLAAAICSGTYFVVQRPLAVRHGAARAASATIIGGAVCLLPWLPEGVAQAWAMPNAGAAVLYLAIGPSIFGYICWTRSLHLFGAARASNFLNLMIPLSMVLAIPVNRIYPDVFSLIGGVLAITGVWVVNRSKSPNR